jgi:hypothetical protein
MGLHTGEAALEGDAYLGLGVTHAARLCALGHGGQILLSRATHDLVAGGSGLELRDLGVHPLAGLPGPERVFQLVAPGLRAEFPPLRIAAPERGRLGEILRRRREKTPTLEEAAWRAQALLPAVAAPLRPSLAGLGADLFTAHRAAVGADNFLARVDGERLASRLSEQREKAIVSERARTEADVLDDRIACVERLSVRREALAALAGGVSSRLEETLSEAAVSSARERVTAATALLDQAFGQAVATLDPSSFKLGRTRHRGVYRSGSVYVVPFEDEVTGGERRREFGTLAEARDFRTALRLAEKAQSAYTGPSYRGGEGNAGSGPG